MRFTVDLTSAVPIYAQLVAQVKHAIAAGTLAPGDALPSLREASLRLRVSPLTVKKAYEELEALGIVVTEHGRGTYVSAAADTRSAAYRREALTQAVDRLLVEAHHLDAPLDDVIALIRERKAALEETE
jgi:GntR family transcriptional regulator